MDEEIVGITERELKRLRFEARKYLKDAKGFLKLEKDLQESVLTTILLDKKLGLETWRSSERISADSRGRFTKMAAQVMEEMKKAKMAEAPLLEGVIGEDKA